MATTANGTFEVKLEPNLQVYGATLGRMFIDKQFRGDLEATSRGEMLAAMTGVESSAGYVALERVSGKLHDRSRTFVLQHSGTMNRGIAQLLVTVVPDSGTEELVGLAGTMTIDADTGKHSYELQYTFGDAA